jgi:hypothetical protein
MLRFSELCSPSTVYVKKDHLFFPNTIDLTHGAFFYSHYKISNGPISIFLTRQFSNAHEVLNDVGLYGTFFSFKTIYFY